MSENKNGYETSINISEMKIIFLLKCNMFIPVTKITLPIL